MSYARFSRERAAVKHHITIMAAFGLVSASGSPAMLRAQPTWRVVPSVAVGWFGGVDDGKTGGPTASLAAWVRTTGTVSLRSAAFYNRRIDDVGVSCISFECFDDGYPEYASAAVSVVIGDGLKTGSHFYGLVGADAIHAWGGQYLRDAAAVLPHLGGGYASTSGIFLETRVRGRERWNGRKFGDVSLLMGWRLP
jgi:hypothetical protein